MVHSKKRTIVFTLVICLFTVVFFTGCAKMQALSDEEIALQNESMNKYTHPTMWEKSIERIEARYAKTPAPKNPVIFVGSSSIGKWNVKKWFPDLTALNHGFGGSQMVDSWYYADRIVTPYKPKTVVFYAGDNDIAKGKPPEMVLVDFKAFMIKVRQALPKTRIICIAIKPSISRWKVWPQMKEANDLIQAYCEKQKNMFFVDVSKVMIDDSGQVIKDMFIADGLHMNDKGYELWTELVRPLIDE